MSHDARPIRRAFKEVFNGATGRLATEDAADHEQLGDHAAEALRELKEKFKELEAQFAALSNRVDGLDEDFQDILQNGRESF